MKNLSAGNIEKARSIAEKFRTWSSFLNYHTMAHMTGDLEGAAMAITTLIGQYKQQLLDGLSLYTINISEIEFFQLYYDLISEDYSSAQILKAFRMLENKSLDVYDVFLNIISQSYAAKINNLITIADSTPESDSESNRLAGLTLKEKSEPLLSEFKAIANKTSTYTIIADKLALQILQNGINYYNNTNEEDAARRIMAVFVFAQNIAVGPLAKERCKQNFTILKKAYDELPPIEAISDIKAIEKIVEFFSSSTSTSILAKDLVLRCAPYLGNLKEKCGLSHPAVVKISTQIVCKALNSVIADVNLAIWKINHTTSWDKATAFSNAKNVLVNAWDVIVHLDQLPLYEDTKEWYNSNCKRIADIMGKAGVPTWHSGAFRIKTEPEYFRGCKTKNDYQEYLKFYPNARYRYIAQNRISEFEKQEEFERKRCGEKHRVDVEKKSKNVFTKIVDFFKDHPESLMCSIICLVILLSIGFIWELRGIQTCLYIFGGISAFIALSGFRRKYKDKQAFFLIAGLIALLFLGGAYLMEEAISAKEEQALYNSFSNNPNAENFKAYIEAYPQGKYITKVTSKYLEIIKTQGPLALNLFIYDYPLWGTDLEVENIISQQCDSLYNIAMNHNTREAWENYQKAVPTDQLRDSQDWIEAIDNREWSTEYKAWAKASGLGTLDGYYKYINMYPNGSHSSIAYKRIIDLEVDDVMGGEHGELPSMGQTVYGHGPTSNISVYNNTSYNLTLSYSGPDSKRISITPHNHRSITLKNGTYRCVASVDENGIIDNAGTESLKGGSYEVEYYISNSSIPYK